MREARNGRVPVPSPDGRRSETTDVRSRLRLSREVPSPWRSSPRAAALAYNQSREHLLRTTGRSQVSTRTSASAYEAGPHSQPTSYSRPYIHTSSHWPSRDSQPEVAPTDTRGGTGVSLLGDYLPSLDHSEIRDEDSFGEAMNILGADGMRPQTQRQFEDRWQQVNRPSADNTRGRSRVGYLSSAGRYSRRGAFGLPTQTGDLTARGNLGSTGPAARRHSLSSQSPIRNDNSPERLATTAANYRASRLRLTTERVIRDAMGDHPRPPHHRLPRNIGDYMVCSYRLDITSSLLTFLTCTAL